MNKVKIYWQKQGVDRLCGVHCINSLLQGPFFNEVTLANIALELDKKEHSLMVQQGMTKQFLKYMQQDSGNVAMDGYYSIQVLQQALKSLNLDMIPVQKIGAADLLKKTGFICNSSDHWFSIRNINGIWYNLNSTNKRLPEIISDFYLEAFIISVKDQGYQIFSVEGHYPDSSEDKFDYYNKNQQWYETKRIQKYHEKVLKRKNYKPNISGAGADHQMQKAIALSLGKQYKKYVSSGEDSDWDNDDFKDTSEKKEIKAFTGAGVTFGDNVSVNYQKFSISAEDVEMITFLKQSLQEQYKEEPKQGKQVSIRFSNGKKIRRRFQPESTIENLYDFVWMENPTNSHFYITNYATKQKLLDVSIPLFAIEDQDGDISVIVNE